MPFYPIDLDHLAARGPVRRLAARNVVGVFHVDDEVAGLVLFLDEFERPRPDHLGDLLVWVGLGQPLRHDERRQARHLGKAVDQQRERLLQIDREILVVAALHVGDCGGERLAECVARHPAFDRGDAVGPAYRLPVMEFEAVAQRETVVELVRRDLELADHLGLRPELGVDREQRVEHHVAVVAGDVGRRPDRIEHLHIGLRDKAQGLRAGTLSLGFEPGGGEGCRPCGDTEFATRHPVSHP